ncbi:MAG: tetratricopeptide repeat protein [Rhodocyclaceae bacterium]|nr:tetratricopeptide repeat protein [Rhodocyclaceae bacterium]
MTPLPRNDAKGGAEHLTLAYPGPTTAQAPQVVPPNGLPGFLSSESVRLALAALGGAGLAVLLMESFFRPPQALPAPPQARLAAAAPATPATIPLPQAGLKKPAAAPPAQADKTPAAAASRSIRPEAGERARLSPSAPSSGRLDGESDALLNEQAITIRHGAGNARLNPVLLSAWSAFQAGNLKDALAGYQRAAQEEPNNTDALHGLAAIALRQGRPAEAATMYRHILELAPQDTLAQTSLVSLAQAPAGETEESHLQSILARAPQSAAAQFSLGNLYARDGRWREAEQAYFNALALEPDNPDYCFNLAVSLDQLGQGREAARHYRAALAQSAGHPTGFDPAQAAARLAELEP